jgi:hypothetical protein
MLNYYELAILVHRSGRALLDVYGHGPHQRLGSVSQIHGLRAPRKVRSCAASPNPYHQPEHTIFQINGRDR